MKWVEPYTINWCQSCQTLFSSPMPTPEQLGEFYQGFLYRKPDPANIKTLAEKKSKEIHRFYKQIDQTSRFLDYGGGTGVATLAADNLGFETHYFEIDRQAHEFVSENTSVVEANMYFEDEAIPKNYFDLIWCDNVIEHVLDPLEFIQKLVAMLAPGGKLVIKTPNCRNNELLFFPLVSIFGYSERAAKSANDFKKITKCYFSKFWCCDPPRHLFSFSPKGLLDLCAKIPETHEKIFYYKLPPFEYLILPKILRRPKPFSAGWLARFFAGTIELLLKPVYLLYRPFTGAKSAGLGIEIVKEHSAD